MRTWNVRALYEGRAFPGDTRQVGKPAVRWRDSVEDLKAMGFINWKRKA